MKVAHRLRALTVGCFAVLLAAAPALSQDKAGDKSADNNPGGDKLDKVSFGTNWVAEAEHGGFFQALADGTYRK